MDSLDAIVEAVSEVILVFEAVQQNDKNLVVDVDKLNALVGAIGDHVDQRRRILDRIEDPQFRDRMVQTCIEISNATARLQIVIHTHMHRNKLSPESYSALHQELRNILQNMVLQLQITDQVNVGILLNTTKRNLDCVARVAKAENIHSLIGLSREASNVGVQLQIQLTQRIAEITDWNLRSRLQEAAEVLATGSPVLIAAVQSYLDNTNSAEKKQKKDEAARILLEALGEVISVTQASAKYVGEFALIFDMPEAKLKPQNKQYFEFNRSPRVDEELSRIEDCLRSGQDKAISLALQGLLSEVKRQVEDVNEFAKSMKDVSKAEALLKEVEKLATLTPEIVEAVKAVLQDPTNKAALERLNRLIKEAREINRNIQDAKKPEKELMKAAQLLHSCLAGLASSCRNGDAIAAAHDLKQANGEIESLIRRGKDLADLCKDPKRKEGILKGVEELQQLVPKLAAAVKACIDKPGDAAAQQELDEIISQINKVASRILAEYAEDQLKTNKEQLGTQVNALKQAVKQGDQKAAANTLMNIADLVKRRVELGKALALKVKDPKVRQQILKSCEAIERALPELVVATKQALLNPNDQAALDNLEESIQQLNAAADGITTAPGRSKYNRLSSLRKSRNSLLLLKDQFKVGGQDHTAEEIAQNHRGLQENSAKLRSAIQRKDNPEAIAATKEIAAHLTNQVALGRKLAAQCQEPVLKQKVLDACDKMEGLCPQIVQATKTALLNPDDPRAKQHLEGLLTEANAASQVVTDAAEHLRSKTKQVDEIASHMSQKLALVERVEVQDELENADPLLKAAQMVDNAAKKAQAEAFTTPEQKSLLDIASSIAKAMEKLSAAAKKGSKTDMINTAREIAAIINKIESFSKQVADHCNDSVLREQLISMSRVPRNFGVQLKIIAAVKATSGDEDATAEMQLVNCAQGLANSVVQTVAAAQAAALATVKAK